MVENRITKLEKEPKELLFSLYIDVYSGHPWHEQYECKNENCGVTYSDGCKRENSKICDEFVKRENLYLKKGKFCGNCGGELEKCLKPMWTKEVVAEDFENALNQDEFIGNGIRLDEELVGFYWGFKMPNKDTHHVWYEKAGKMLLNEGIDPSRVFYHTEIGISPKHQGKGLGKKLLFASSKEASEKFDIVLYRTVNPAVNHIYATILDTLAIPIFKDPNPAKDQLWYAFNLKRLKEK